MKWQADENNQFMKQRVDEVFEPTKQQVYEMSS